MDDFASAAMMRLIKLAIEKQAIKSFSPPSASAHVQLEQKRSLIEELLAKQGPLFLLQVGQMIKHAPKEPVMVALAMAHDPHDLLVRWQRLERFTHSRHRTEIIAQSDHAVTLRHFATNAHPSPLQSEDLLVFGQLMALFEYCGAESIRARLVGEGQWRFSGGNWRNVHFPTDCSSWQIEWRGVCDNRQTVPTTDGLRDVLVSTRSAFERDPSRSWTVVLLADELGLSKRSLQRRLHQVGETFSNLLMVARLNTASAMLIDAKVSLAEIGYAAGFSDQAHFTREFKRLSGTTPLNYKTQFSTD